VVLLSVTAMTDFDSDSESPSHPSPRSFATAVSTPRPASPASTVTSECMTERDMQSNSTFPSIGTPADQTLKPGVYKILNDFNPESVIDLSGHDDKTMIGMYVVLPGADMA